MLLEILCRVQYLCWVKPLVPLLKKMRNEAEKQQGFVSRTTYSKMNDPGECIVVSTWKSADHCSSWMNKKEVKELQCQVDSLIGEKAIFEIYQPEEF